jgi:alcohol dehydrogenase (cytochrome c)
VAWVTRQRAPQTTGVLATAGGVIFAGALDRVFSAYDSATGVQLWKTRLNDVPNSSPITYMVNGKQYIALTICRRTGYDVPAVGAGDPEPSGSRRGDLGV